MPKGHFRESLMALMEQMSRSWIVGFCQELSCSVQFWLNWFFVQHLQLSVERRGFLFQHFQLVKEPFALHLICFIHKMLRGGLAAFFCLLAVSRGDVHCQ